MAHYADFGPPTMGPSRRLKSLADQQRLCRRLVQLTTVLVIPVVLVRRLLGLGGSKSPVGARPTVIAEAHADASAIIPYIFMG